MQTRMRWATLAALGIVGTLLSACVLAAFGAEPEHHEKEPPRRKDVLQELEKAKERLSPTYRLAYRLAPGEELRTKVVHLATVETKIKGVAQITRSRTLSTRLWRIREVDPQGNITLDHLVEQVEMWNSVEGRQEQHYDSTQGQEPPPEFAPVAASVGKVLATIQIDPHGRILARTNVLPQFNPGLGELTIPFPDQPIKAGTSWSIPEELRIQLEDGTLKRIQTRQQYRLEKVEAGVATITVQTEVLTPVTDPKVQAQLVQRLQRGTLQFDVDAGRLIRKQMDIDEEVFGFSGPDSHMQYLARFTEEALPAGQSARHAAAPQTAR